MAGDAGTDAGRDPLTPTDGPDQPGTQQSDAVQPGADQPGTDQPGADVTGVDTPDDSDDTDTGGTDTNGTDIGGTDTDGSDGTPDVGSDAVTDPVAGDAPDGPADEGRPEPRAGLFTRGWVAAGVATLAVLAAAVTAAGMLAWRADDATAAASRADAAAMAAARTCVSATHAPDLTAMTQAQTAIIECSTGDFAVQATFYSGVLVDAYQAADVRMRMAEMHSAVEKHNDDGSIDVLVAFRVAMSNAQSQDKEIGYRLRAVMALDDGRFKIARLDTVSS